jgi:putative membrane protein
MMMKPSGIFFKTMIFFMGFFLIAKEALAEYRNYCGWGPGMMGWGWGWVHLLFMVIFWVLIVLLIILLIRRLGSSGHPNVTASPQEDSALEILKKRYARSEINKEEFDTKKKDLM